MREDMRHEIIKLLDGGTGSKASNGAKLFVCWESEQRPS
jgi:hypothetical protein